jgi:molybdopterin/thiamine biosynthesis adenylyltransferase
MLKVTLWDYDVVESHNIPNQMFGVLMVGENKATAMADTIQLNTGITHAVKGKWEGEALSGVVMCCVDNMDVRRKVLESMTSGMFIEVRMGVYHGQVFSIDPEDPEACDFWMDNWCGDDVVEEKSACGTSLTIGSTAALLASIANWQLINYMNGEVLPRKLTVSVKPYTIIEES